jgi:hypothetical protein
MHTYMLDDDYAFMHTYMLDHDCAFMHTYMLFKTQMTTVHSCACTRACTLTCSSGDITAV